MSVVGDFPPKKHGHRYHGLTLRHISFLYYVFSLFVILMVTILFVPPSIALPVPPNSSTSTSNNNNNNVNDVTVISPSSPVNSTMIPLALSTDSNSTQTSLLTEDDLNGNKKKSNISEIAKNELKHAAKHLGISLLSGFTGSTVGQALRVGGVRTTASEARAEMSNSAASAGLKVTSLTAMDNASTNNTKLINATSSVNILKQALVGGAAAGLVGFGVITALGGVSTPAFMLANAAGSVVWNRTQTAINRHVFGVGLRNKTADTRSRLERVKDTTIGLLPNIAGGLMNGFVGGKVVGALSASPAVAKLGDVAKTMLGETLSSGAGGMVQEETARAVRTAANNIDTPFTSIMRGDKTRNLTMNAQDSVISGTTFFGGKSDASSGGGSGGGTSSNVGRGGGTAGRV
ncbi:hypothetical protein BDF22DRAFT_678999 [Syncephalis plumigaleata]|nr:hypothetical protein BDF22DRAFT_678999 [Syncephalis plumigaleata]